MTEPTDKQLRVNVSRQGLQQRRLKSEGRCVKCWGVSDYGTLCLKCNTKHREYERAKRGHKPWRKGRRGRPPFSSKLVRTVEGSEV